MSNTSVACPGEAVLFTCSSPGTSLRWQVDLRSPAGTSLQSFFLPSQVGGRRTLGPGVIIFEAVLVSNDGGTLTSTLINLSKVSVLDDSNVTCTVTNNGSMSQQQTIMVAGEYLYFIIIPEIFNFQLSQHVHSIQAYPSFKTSSVRPLSLWSGTLPPLLVVCLSAMFSPSPQHLSLGQQSPWRPPPHRSLSPITHPTM